MKLIIMEMNKFAYVFLNIVLQVSANCAMQNYCNGHGYCNGATSTCVCYEGFGATTDITNYRAPDCSAVTCPSGKAWADLPTSSTVAHALAECSNMGICDRTTGTCNCFPGFTGNSCQRNTCPNDCSGHGQCFSMKQLARQKDALPLNANTYYEGDEDTTTWDSEKLFACVCDSSWTVGLSSGERQLAEWFGPDCSLRRCPSAPDPYTTTLDETDCEGKSQTGGSGVGEAGNLCHIDCANRGICDYSTGECSCFEGYYGTDCSLQSVLASGKKK